MTTHHISHRLLLAAVAQGQPNRNDKEPRPAGRYLAEKGGKAITIALEVLQGGKVLRSEVARPLRLASTAGRV